MHVITVPEDVLAQLDNKVTAKETGVSTHNERGRGTRQKSEDSNAQA